MTQQPSEIQQTQAVKQKSCLHFSVDRDPSVFLHESVADQEGRSFLFQLGERTIICSFRRLPSWLKSRYSFEYQRSPHLPHIPERLLEDRCLETDGTLSHAEYYVHKYLPDDILTSNPVRFLRTEYFETDFKTIFGEFLNIFHISDSKFSRKVNVSQKYLPRIIKKKLYKSPEQIYSHCPSWQKIKALTYGG
jgi:hypothetical protein